MILNVGGRRAEKRVIGCQISALEMCVERRLLAGMMEQAVNVMTTSDVGDDQAARRHERDRSGMVARDHAAHETPSQPP